MESETDAALQIAPPSPAEGKANTPLQSPVHRVAAGLYLKRLLFVNVVFIGEPGGPWVLVDTGLAGYATAIRQAAEALYGTRPPEAIVLTHGHFDHVGSLETLLGYWPVPVYTHPLEAPFLKGTSTYPPPDPTVGGGIMPAMSLTFPRGPIDVGPLLQMLPADGSVPGLPGWRWIHTPGHAPGHISLWREEDRALVAGDAVTCTRQESAYMVATQTAELNGPPRYFTPDWVSAERSAQVLALLEPEILITGHGPALEGPAMRQALHHLAAEFRTEAVPHRGRYVGEPARSSTQGVEFVPPMPLRPYLKAALWVSASVALLWAVRRLRNRD